MNGNSRVRPARRRGFPAAMRWPGDERGRGAVAGEGCVEIRDSVQSESAKGSSNRPEHAIPQSLASVRSRERAPKKGVTPRVIPPGLALLWVHPLGRSFLLSSTALIQQVVR